MRDLDGRFAGGRHPRLGLRLIGSTALMLQSSYQRGTKDVDVLESNEVEPGARADLLALAGRGTVLALRHAMYLEFVPGGIPFLPQQPRWHVVPGLADLRGFTVEVLDVVDVVDVVVAKIARWSALDQQDARAVIERDLVPHALLVDRFRAAVDWLVGDARANQLPRYVDRLHELEETMLAVEPTAIDLPSWI